MIPQLTIVKNEILSDSVQYFIVEHIPQLSVTGEVIGIDPGTTHIGVSFFLGRFSELWEISVLRGKTTEERIACIQDILDEYILSCSVVHQMVCEGASYADKYRQVELQDIRCGAVSWAMYRGMIEIQIIPPNTIRKVVFGSAKIKNPWKEQGIPDNAAAALGCALYPIMKGQ